MAVPLNRLEMSLLAAFSSTILVSSQSYARLPGYRVHRLQFHSELSNSSLTVPYLVHRLQFFVGDGKLLVGAAQVLDRLFQVLWVVSSWPLN